MRAFVSFITKLFIIFVSFGNFDITANANVPPTPAGRNASVRASVRECVRECVRDEAVTWPWRRRDEAVTNFHSSTVVPVATTRC